jgi:hypothetical protein
MVVMEVQMNANYKFHYKLVDDCPKAENINLYDFYRTMIAALCDTVEFLNSSGKWLIFMDLSLLMMIS